jgi:hypothetical protein
VYETASGLVRLIETNEPLGLAPRTKAGCIEYPASFEEVEIRDLRKRLARISGSFAL